jgi:hypothetical protein
MRRSGLAQRHGHIERTATCAVRGDALGEIAERGMLREIERERSISPDCGRGLHYFPLRSPTLGHRSSPLKKSV